QRLSVLFAHDLSGIPVVSASHEFKPNSEVHTWPRNASAGVISSRRELPASVRRVCRRRGQLLRRFLLHQPFNGTTRPMSSSSEPAAPVCPQPFVRETLEHP